MQSSVLGCCWRPTTPRRRPGRRPARNQFTEITPKMDKRSSLEATGPPCAPQPVSAASLASAIVTARKTLDVAPRTSANAASLRRKRWSLNWAAKAAIWFVVLLMLGRAARTLRAAAPRPGHWVAQPVVGRGRWRDDLLPRAAPAQPTANRGVAARGRGAGRATRGGRGGRGGRGRGRGRGDDGLTSAQRTAAKKAAKTKKIRWRPR